MAHRESLASNDAFTLYREFKYVDKIARKLYEWSSRSVKRHAFLADIVKSFGIGRRGKLRPQKMHDIRWLSKGQVLIKVIRLMPAYLTVMKTEDLSLYGSLTNYKVQFLLYFFADVLGELNILNCKFQEAYADISSIGDHLTSVMETFRLAFLGSTFGSETKHTESFIKTIHAQKGVMMYKDDKDVTHSHCLHLGPMCDADVANPHETYDYAVTYMIHLCQSYIKSLMQSLWDRFKADFDVFEATKYFSPKHYDGELEKLDVSSRNWLEVLCKHFSRGDDSFLNDQECKGERRSFVTRMRNCFKGKDMYAAWSDTNNHDEWEHSFPWTMKLWRALLVLPLSTVACERGFSKMNKIKSKFRNQLSLDSLNLLMFINMNTPKVVAPSDILWNECFDAWKGAKKRRAGAMMTT
ncbi:hypothetical protein L7F22_031085 [Adiantum nelumboides]|nr:hypothetical protein [Adiantum nelumboides]